uniref:Anthocyanidin reductase n=1 Tax=Chenopodium quinoa TaxID=63459 RepID=A0A803KZK5_CHEQI
MSCIRSGTVKRLVYTATVMAASPLKDDASGFKDIMDESCWTPIHHPFVNSLPLKDYVISKTESEKAALKFGEDGDLEIVTLACGYRVSLYKTLKELDVLCGKIPIIHLEDACEAHIFCIENDSIKGRFLCASDYVSAAEIAECLQQTHPELNVKPMYMEGPKRAVKWGSTKLIDQGFEYKHDLKMILDDSVKFWRKLDGSL